MKLLSWKYRGLGNSRTVNALRSRCGRDSPNIFFVMETMISADDLAQVRSKCSYVDGFCVSSIGLSGGLSFWWKDIDVHIIPTIYIILLRQWWIMTGNLFGMQLVLMGGPTQIRRDVRGNLCVRFGPRSQVLW